MSVSTTRNLDREKMRRFVRCWDRLLEVVPEARREAVKAAGEAVKRLLDVQIQSADLSSIEAKGRVKSWQQLRLGSKGGWAAISSIRKTPVLSFEPRANWGGRYKQHEWNGEPVTAGQITSWLDQGHGVGVRGHTASSWKIKRLSASPRKGGWGSAYVPGRRFYVSTKDDALKIALKAADKVLCRIADEVDF